MNVLFADGEVYDGYRQNDQEQNNRRGGCERRIAAAVPVKHIVDISDDRVHFGGVKFCAEQRDRVAVGFERTDKAGYDQIKNHRGDHRDGDFEKGSGFRRIVDTRRVIVIFIDGSECACEDQYFERKDDPDCVDT